MVSFKRNPLRQISVFQTVDKAVEELKHFNEIFSYQYTEFSRQEIILKSVDSSIYRAFRNLNEKPSDIYRSWIAEKFDSILINFKQTKSQEQFDILVLELTDSLIKHWKKRVSNSESKIMYGPASKIINLIFKMIQESKKFQIIKNQKFLHVPFDEYSIKPLQIIINDLSDVDYKISIPDKPSMKFITTPDLYNIIHHAVKRLCSKAKIFPIVYDYWSWNDKH